MQSPKYITKERISLSRTSVFVSLAGIPGKSQESKLTYLQDFNKEIYCIEAFVAVDFEEDGVASLIQLIRVLQRFRRRNVYLIVSDQSIWSRLENIRSHIGNDVFIVIWRGAQMVSKINPKNELIKAFTNLLSLLNLIDFHGICPLPPYHGEAIPQCKHHRT